MPRQNNLKIVSAELGITCGVKTSNLAKENKPIEIVRKSPDGKVVEYCQAIDNGETLTPIVGKTVRRYREPESGNLYEENELTYWIDGEQRGKVSQTKVFEVTSFEPLQNYTDKYIIDKYYKVTPSNDGFEKDLDRKQAVRANNFQMRKLWEYLNERSVVARGIFNMGSGFQEGDGYIRAIKDMVVDDSGTPVEVWGLEIGAFKESKNLDYLQREVPDNTPMPRQEQAPQTRGVRRI